MGEIEHSESKILHTAELMRVGTSEYIKDFVEVKPEKGHLIRSSTLGDLTRDSSSETENENDSGSASETEEGSDFDNQIDKLMDALKKHRDEDGGGDGEELEVSISIPSHHGHMVSYDDVKNAIDAMKE